MSSQDFDPTQNALDELLAKAGVVRQETSEYIIEKAMEENVKNGPGRYRVPGIVDRNGQKVIVGNYNLHIVPEPSEPQSLEQLEHDAARMRELYGLNEVVEEHK